MHDTKINYQALAAEMGPECTPKAITHQIAKIKATGKTESGGAPNSTPRKSAANSTPRRGGRASGGKGRNKKNKDDEDQEEDDGEVNTPTIEKDRSNLRRNGSTKHSYEESAGKDSDNQASSTSVAKRIKREDSTFHDDGVTQTPVFPQTPLHSNANNDFGYGPDFDEEF